MSTHTNSPLAALVQGLTESRGLWLPEPTWTVPCAAASTLTRETFFTNYVVRSSPLIITGAADAWPATVLRDHGMDELVKRYGDSIVTVNVTPNGVGDAPVLPDCGRCLHSRVFVRPEERRMPLATFSTMMRADSASEVAYLSYQNDNARREIPSILHSLLPLTSVGAGDSPWPWCPWTAADAINLWIGSSRSSSWTHKDHYENIVVCLAGKKVLKR